MALKISLLLLPILVVFFLTDEIAFYKMKTTIYDETLGAAADAIDSTTQLVESRFENTCDVFQAVNQDPALKRYVSYYTNDQYVSERGTLVESNFTSVLRTYLDTMPTAVGSGIYLSSYRIKSVGKNLTAETTAEVNNILRRNEAVIFSTQLWQIRQGNTNLYLVAQPMSNGLHSYLLFSILTEDIFNPLKQSYLTSNVEYCVFCGGRLLFQTTGNRLTEQRALDAIKTTDASQRNEIKIVENGDMTCMVASMKNPELTLVALPPIVYPQDAISSAYRISFGSRLIAAIVTLLLFLLIITTFTLQIRRINDVMKRVESGDKKAQYQSPYTDELSQLGHHLNAMVLQIREQESEMEKKKMEVKESQLHALQNQINPHFLYNALEHIRMQAISIGHPEIGDQIKTMGEMFRYNIHNEISTVTLQEEYDQVLRYLSLQKSLLEDRLNIVTDTDTSVMKHPVIKFLLQPLVENAIVHGISGKLSPSDLYIGIHDDGDNIDFEVSDTGTGMTEKALQEIRESLASSSAMEIGGRQPVGLKNVNERLILFYGRDAALHIDSSPESGTTVTFSIPSGQISDKESEKTDVSGLID